MTATRAFEANLVVLLAREPRKGTALVFNDVLDSGLDDERTEHSGTPPNSGVKYAINCWIRARNPSAGMLSSMFGA